MVENTVDCSRQAKCKKNINQYNRQHSLRHSHSGNIFSIDYYAYTSNMRNWNPSFKVGFALIMLLISVLANNLYVSVLIITAMSYLSVVKGRLSLHDYLSVLMIPVFFLILGSIAIAIGFSTKQTGDYYIAIGNLWMYTTKEDIVTLANLWGKAFAAISAMYMMTLSTPSSEVISVLRRLKVPKLIIELMNLIYRYIFIIMDVQCKMKNSAESRLGYCDLKTACYSFGSIASNLLLVSLKKAAIYFDAMEARCYEGELLFLEEEKPLNKKHLIYAMVYIIMIIGIWMITN